MRDLKCILLVIRGLLKMRVTGNIRSIPMPYKDENVRKAYHKQQNRKYYLANKEKVLASSKLSRATGKARWDTFKLTLKCTKCGFNHPAALDFHHVDPSKKENIISNPKINDDVFITRQELSAFEKNYRLEYIRNLVDLETYAGGNYFNIINNT
jgi:hypothetical protein